MYASGLKFSTFFSPSKMFRSFTMPFCARGERKGWSRQKIARVARRRRWRRRRGEKGDDDDGARRDRSSAPRGEGAFARTHDAAATDLHELPSLVQGDDLAIVHHPPRALLGTCEIWATSKTRARAPRVRLRVTARARPRRRDAERASRACGV
jgi:hypothetical protein